ncbi:MAG TPA: uroporphyrinogen-III synthase [Gemmatimonadales bacterium]
METVVLTASAGTFPGLAKALRDIPVDLVERPLMSFRPPVDWGPLDAALARVSTYGSVAFTSPRAAQALVERMRARAVSWREGPRPAVWAVGPATVAALQDILGPVRVPHPYPDENLGAAGALARAMLDAKADGPVLFPCGERRRTELPAMLRERGIQVDEVVCYRAMLADESQARAAVESGTLLVVASPTVADLLARVCPPLNRPDLLAVGPTTAAAAEEAGWAPAAIAGEPSAQALALAITGLLARR